MIYFFFPSQNILGKSSHLPNDLSISNSGIANSGQLWLDTVLLGGGREVGVFMISLSSLY